MTENTMPTAAEETPGRDRKLLVVAGGAAGLLVLGGAGFMLLHGGGSSDEQAFAVAKGAPKTSHVTTASNVKGAAAKGKAVTKTVPATSTVRIGRDPFSALYVVPVDVPEAPAAPTTTGTTTGSTPTGSTTTGSTTGTTSTPAKPVTAPVATTYPLRLVRVYGSGKDQTAVFSVNSKTQLAKVGSVFGRTSELKLLSLQQNSKGAWVATVQVGDADPFDLAPGETVRVM